MNFDALQQLIAGTPLNALQPYLEDSFLDAIRHGDHRRWLKLVAELPQITPSQCDYGDTIRIGLAQDCEDSIRDELERQLRELIPWRKGPFELFGIRIDSEWQSQLKWARLAATIEPLTGRAVLDVGSGNGYSSLRMYGEGARLVIGLEPHIPYYGQFSAIKHFIPDLPVFVLPLSLERMPLPLPQFDTVFSMGVIYHRRSPLDHLLQLSECLRPGGQLIMESIVVAGEEGYSLLPEDRYARMNNVWFLPSVPTLLAWLKRCNFQNPRVVDTSETTPEEQRSTDWMPFESLQHSLQENNRKLTVEGYPAPQRVVILCEKS
ncbi:MAG: tRNA 5-methoxyuridine(34)/uridine 5-oxyacetic acid(34) synthase CmoB [Pseudomonadales bacterium]|nr:tRNA 5-methoxyuridine(34)/uridine 5-oxyacetic acid(34) synthase CmoB [Pseudomonadales bacterium]